MILIKYKKRSKDSNLVCNFIRRNSMGYQPEDVINLAEEYAARIMKERK